MDDSTYAVLIEALRVGFILGVPILISFFSATLIVGGIQLFLGFYDHSLSFCVRLVAVVVTLYFMLPTALVSFSKLLELALTS